MKNMRIVCTALTGRIMAATILKDGKNMGANRLDVTSDVLKALIDKADFHGGEFDIDNGTEKWIVTVRKERAALVSQSTPPPESAGQGLSDADISCYSLLVSDKRFADEIMVQRARQIEGTAVWAVRLNGDCLNKQGEWEWEPMPSGRDDEFLARCRFASAEEALNAARAILAANRTAQQDGGSKA